MRGTREPERSITHSQNLEKFIRELEAFRLDEGHSRDQKWDENVKRFRVEFDKLQTAVHQCVTRPITYYRDARKTDMFFLLLGPKMVNQCHNQVFPIRMSCTRLIFFFFRSNNSQA